MSGMWWEVIRVIKHGSNTLEHLHNLSQQYLDHDHQSLIMSHSRIIALIRHCLIFFSYSWPVSVVSDSAQFSSDIRFQMKCFTVFASQSPGSYSPLHPFILAHAWPGVNICRQLEPVELLNPSTNSIFNCFTGKCISFFIFQLRYLFPTKYILHSPSKLFE